MSVSKNLEYKKTSFLNKSNNAFIEQMYVKFINKDPSLPRGWKEYFLDIGEDLDSVVKEIKGPSWSPKKVKIKENSDLNKEVSTLNVNQADTVADNSNSIRAVSLIRSYRQRGHLLSKLDPLGIRESEYLDELHPENYGFNYRV
jgi:2-oxoglutarate dehydrogenase E1 component